MAAIEAVLASGEQIVNLALARPDGHSLLLNFFPIRDAHGAVAQVGCLFSDVTQYVEAHETIEAQGRRSASSRRRYSSSRRRPGGAARRRDGYEPCRELTERLLHAIPRARARDVVFDVTGVPVIDPDVSHELLNTAAVARLMGARHGDERDLDGTRRGDHGARPGHRRHRDGDHPRRRRGRRALALAAACLALDGPGACRRP